MARDLILQFEGCEAVGRFISENPFYVLLSHYHRLTTCLILCPVNLAPTSAIGLFSLWGRVIMLCDQVATKSS